VFFSRLCVFRATGSLCLRRGYLRTGEWKGFLFLKYPQGMPLVSPLVQETFGMGAECPITEAQAKACDETKGLRRNGAPQDRGVSRCRAG
jgi:hypothetical protein